jgi:hypothetical protein
MLGNGIKNQELTEEDVLGLFEGSARPQTDAEPKDAVLHIGAGVDVIERAGKFVKVTGVSASGQVGIIRTTITNSS